MPSGFAMLTRKMKPCLLKKVNPLEMGGYFIAGWVSAPLNFAFHIVESVVKACCLA